MPPDNNELWARTLLANRQITLTEYYSYLRDPQSRGIYCRQQSNPKIYKEQQNDLLKDESISPHHELHRHELQLEGSDDEIRQSYSSGLIHLFEALGLLKPKTEQETQDGEKQHD